MAKKKLKLYVWEGVLEDWTSGIMFALAENADDARKLIADKMTYETDDLKIEPEEITDREGFYVYGGG